MTRNIKRCTITAEIANLVVSKMESGKYTVSQIAEALEMTRQTVWRILRDEARGIPFYLIKRKKKKNLHREKCSQFKN